MNEQLKEELISRFRSYLETDIETVSDNKPEDRYSLFGEISGLKNEVRIESRQLKSALDDFREAFTTLDRANQDLADKFLLVRNQQKEQEQQVLQPVVIGLMDLFDRLLVALEQKTPKQNVFQDFIYGNRNKQWLQVQQDGHKMILNRVLDLLRLCEVTFIEVNGLRFDPLSMKAVQSVTDPSKPDGMVLKEIRKGFFYGSRVIRPAEVIVNKIPE